MDRMNRKTKYCQRSLPAGSTPKPRLSCSGTISSNVKQSQAITIKRSLQFSRLPLQRQQQTEMRNSPSERKVHQKEILKNIVMSQSMWLIMAPWLLTINFNYLNLFLYLSGGNTLLGLLNRYNKQIKVKIFHLSHLKPSKTSYSESLKTSTL